MRSSLLVFVGALALAVAACAGSDGSGGEPEIATNVIVEPSEVANLEDGTQVITQGVLVIAGDTRLCELLADSFPPQCAEGFTVLGDLRVDDVVALQSTEDPAAQGVSWTAYPVPIVGTVDGGILVNTEVAGPVYEEEGNGLRIRLMSAQRPLFPSELRTGETVWWAIDATNVTDEGIPLTFGSGQVAEVTISDGDNEIYRWSDGKVFTQQVRKVDFEAGRTAAATLSDPFAVPEGTNYTLRAWITGIGAEDVVVSAPVEVIQN